MANYKTQIEAYIGPYSDNDALSQFLTQGAKRVVDLIPDNELRDFGVIVSIPSGGTDTTNIRIISVSGNGYRAKEAAAETYNQFLDPNSLFYAVDRDPVYFYTNGSIFVRPASNADVMYVVSYPEVLFSDEDILQGCHEFDELLVLYAAIQCRVRQYETARAAVPSPPAVPDWLSDNTLMLNALTNDQDIELSAGYSQEIQTKITEFAQQIQLYGLELQASLHQMQFYQQSMASLQGQYNTALQIKFGVEEKSK